MQKKYSLKEITNDFNETTDKNAIKEDNMILFRQNNVVIFLQCDSNSKMTLSYQDDVLRELAEKERLEVESGKVDTSGL